MADKLFKWFLVLVMVYFILHIGFAIGQTAPPPPIVQCWTNGFGTVQCIQI